MKIRCYKVNGKVEELSCSEFVKFFNNKQTGKAEWDACIISLKKQPETSTGARLYKYIHNKHTFYFTNKITKEYFTVKSDCKQSKIPIINTKYADTTVTWNENLKCYVQGRYPAKELLNGELGDRILEYITCSKSSKHFVNLDGDLINVCSQRLRLFKTKGIKCVSCGVEGKWFYKCKGVNEDSYHLELVTKDERKLTKDHILPSSKQGADNLQNYQVMCETCNRNKGNTLSKEDKKNGVTKEELYRMKLNDIKVLCAKHKNSKMSKKEFISRVEKALSSDTLSNSPKKQSFIDRIKEFFKYNI